MSNCFQANNWNVKKFHLDVEIDTKNNTISFVGNVTNLSEYGKKINDKYEKKQSLNENDIGIFFGV